MTQRTFNILALMLGVSMILGACGTDASEKDGHTPALTEPAPVAEKAAETGISAWLETDNQWEEGSKLVTQYSLHIENSTGGQIEDWTAVIQVPEASELRQEWNTEISEDAQTWVLTPEEYNHEINDQEELKDVGWIACCDNSEQLSLDHIDVTMDGASVSVSPGKKETVQTAESKAEPAAKTDNPAGTLSVVNGALCDETGSPVQLKGISTHGLAWYPQYVTLESFRTLKNDWGANTVRLAMYTADSGGYCTDGDQQKLKDLIDKGVRYTEDLGMYVIIDWHILSDSNPQTNEAEAEKFFSEMSEKYSSKSHVIYEICNEPQNSSFKDVIKPYAEKMISVIRENDADALILVGTNTWSQDIDEVIGNEIKDDHVMYTLHFYAGTHKEELRRKLIKALDAGVPVYISECSITDASGNGAINYDSAEEWMNLINEHVLSYNAWSLSNKNESSALINPSCEKVSDWSLDELSDTGKWFREQIRKAG